jgi:hypothetical protein
MPYIKEARRWIYLCSKANTPGELNYEITTLVTDYMERRNMPLSYDQINEVIGVLECAKQELYRRVAAPYENLKRNQNGDVF